MDIALLKAVIMGIVEGATEFLPVSSTGHLILAGDALDFHAGQQGLFEVVIQTGAIFAVILLYFKKLWQTLIGLPTQASARRFALAVALGFFPAAFVGVFAHDYIKAVLFNAHVVSIALIVGGVIMLLIERMKLNPTMPTVDDITLMTALKIGVIQCLAMVPGVSRSGATIIGGLLLGVERKAAAEFSFYLAIPTLLGAAVLDIYKARDVMAENDWLLIAVGSLAAFVSAVVVIKAFIAWLSKHSFAVFGWYRIALGGGLLLASFLGYTL